ncbi:MAG: type II toxin-antitoxin system RelE/ParE family toxin [Ferruginibacter sp.]
MPLIIKWNKHALSQLVAAIDYIREDSPQNAEKVKQEILAIIDKLATYPDFFPVNASH